jgi:hypothetical protein
MFELYGDTSNQVYTVFLYGGSGQYAQRAIKTDNSNREFVRQFSAGVWGAWKEAVCGYLAQNFTFYVDGENGNDSTAKGTEVLPYKTIQAAVSAVPFIFKGTVINIKPGVYHESVTRTTSPCIGMSLVIQGEAGGETVIDPSGSSSGRGIHFQNLACQVGISNLKFICDDTSTAHAGIYLSQIAGYSYVEKCEFDGFRKNGADAACVYMNTCNAGYASGCSFKNASNGLYASRSGNVVSDNNLSGGDLDYGLRSWRSAIRKTSGQPVGTVANEIASGGGQII